MSFPGRICKSLWDWSTALYGRSFSLVLYCVVLSVLIGAGSSRAFAQGTSSIQGRITDPSGSGLPSTAIRATSEETGLWRSTLSSADGYYRISDLLPGTYQIQVEYTGFKRFVRSGVRLIADSMIDLNAALEIGNIAETINVTAEAPQLETTVARVSEVVSENEIRSLPSQGRGILNLTTMTPGITAKAEQDYYCCDAFSVYAAPRLTASGSNDFKSDFTLDGITLRYSSGSYWGALFSPNVDAVSEVRVSVSPYLAEYGRVSGPVVQMVTKGGTNDWHGTGQFSNIDSNLNARPYFNPNIPHTYTRYFGGTGGGPIVRNRLFIFGGYQGLREKTAATSQSTVETRAFYDSVVGNRPNSVAAQILKTAPPKVFPATPLPGNPSLGLVSITDASERTGAQYNARLDYQSASGKDRVYGSYWYTGVDHLNAAARTGFDGFDNTGTHSGNVVHTHTFNPHILNEIRFGYTLLDYDQGHEAQTYSVPGITTNDGLSLGNFAWSRSIQTVKSREISELLTITRGRHTFKVGASYRRALNDNTTLLDGDIPAYRFNSMLDFANDGPFMETRALNVTTGKPGARQRYTIQPQLFLFFQDTWQITPNLTMNYGLRWENFYSVWFGKDRDNWQPIANSSQLTPAGISQVVNAKIERFYDDVLTNFGPRVSFAWDPTGNRKFSIRAGFGLLYDEITSGPIFAASNNPPIAYLANAGPDFGVPIVYAMGEAGSSAFLPQFPPNPALVSPGMTPQGAVVGVRSAIGGAIGDLEVPRVLDTMIGVQYQVTTDLKLEADYRYRRTTNELLQTNLNRVTGDLVDARLDRLNPYFDAINLTTNWGRRFYHGLILSASKRFSDGWSVTGSYTYNHAKSNVFGNDSLNVGQAVVDAFNPNNEFARDDNPHVFTAYSVWHLPILRGKTGWLPALIGGWEFNTIWNFQSGNRFGPSTARRFRQGGDFNADGVMNDRPDQPTADVPRSFSNEQWLAGALNASWFPLPDASVPRVGTLPRDYFRFPGYQRIDAALSKAFPIPKWESGRIQFRAEAFNLFNHVNLSGIATSLESALFGRATSAYQNRTTQLSVKVLF